MENRINQIMTLKNGRKYIILRQAIYKGENYFVAAKLSDDEKKITEDYVTVHEFVKDDKKFVEVVTDPQLLALIMKHLDQE